MKPLKLVASIIIGLSLCVPSPSFASENEIKKQKYLDCLENGKEENLKTNIWFNLKHPMRSWNQETYKIAAFEGSAERREALRRLPKMDGDLRETIHMLLYYKNYAAFNEESTLAHEGLQYMLQNSDLNILVSAFVDYIDTNANKERDRLIGFREDMISPFVDAIHYLAQIYNHHALDYLESLYTYAYTEVKPDLRHHVEEGLKTAYQINDDRAFEETLATARQLVEQRMADSLYTERNK